MNREQILIKIDFIKENKSRTFYGWKRSMIVGYYQQFYYDVLTAKQIDEAIMAACDELKATATRH